MTTTPSSPAQVPRLAIVPPPKRRPNAIQRFNRRAVARMARFVGWWNQPWSVECANTYGLLVTVPCTPEVLAEIAREGGAA